jgi:hypothetical protein
MSEGTDDGVVDDDGVDRYRAFKTQVFSSSWWWLWCWRGGGEGSRPAALSRVVDEDGGMMWWLSPPLYRPRSGLQ